MRQVAVGDAVLLHQQDGSTTLSLIMNILSSTQVQLIYPNETDSYFDAATAPIYQRGTHPGQWEPTDEAVSDTVRRRREGVQMSAHPAAQALHFILTVKLPPDSEEVFSKIGRIYAEKALKSPFYEVLHREGPSNNDDYFYNLLMMGVQEGLRSTLYFLQRFLSLTEVVKVNGAAIIADVKPTHSGTLGIGPGVLNAEYEGFMLLSRATLDRLNTFLKYYFQTTITNPKQNIENLYKLESVLKKTFAGDMVAQSLLDVMNHHRTYLDTQFAALGQATERNKLAHQEYVGFAWPNILYNQEGFIRVAFVYTGNRHVDATDELADRFEKLKNFILALLRAFFSLHG